jgi:hypothetical protein
MRWPDAPLCINFLTKKAPYKGLGADSEEKREPASDIDTAVVDSLKELDPERPIREGVNGAKWQSFMRCRSCKARWKTKMESATWASSRRENPNRSEELAGA